MSRDEIARQAKAFQAELNDMKGAADFTFGNYAVFKGNNGEIAQTGKDDVSLGRWAKVRLLAFEAFGRAPEDVSKDVLSPSTPVGPHVAIRVLRTVAGEELWRSPATGQS